MDDGEDAGAERREGHRLRSSGRRFPVLALIASGHLRADDIEQAVRLAPDLPDLDAAALLIELGRRLGVRLTVPSERRRGA